MSDRSFTIPSHEINHPQWQTAADLTSLVPDGVHVWRASADQLPQVLDQLMQTLSADEQDRVGRLRFAPHRCRAIASRGILRSILAGYLNCNPEIIKFQYGTQGKPRVDASPVASLEFNLSHSKDLIVCAIALQPVGIDVEFFREMTDCDPLIKRYFSVQEQGLLDSLPFEARQRAFFDYWTGKEAILKALGLGLSALKLVELRPVNKRIQPFSIAGCGQSATAWQLHFFEPEPDYIASLAIASSTLQLKYWQW